jgi:hypothetical protein
MQNERIGKMLLIKPLAGIESYIWIQSGVSYLTPLPCECGYDSYDASLFNESVDIALLEIYAPADANDGRERTWVFGDVCAYGGCGHSHIGGGNPQWKECLWA